MSLHSNDIPCGPAARLGGADPCPDKPGAGPSLAPSAADIIAGANGQQTANFSMRNVLLIAGVALAALAFITSKRG